MQLVETDGDLAAFLERDRDAATLTMWSVRVPQPTLILGSTQRNIDVSRSVPVVRRRSGGGAVYVHPDTTLWLEVFVPRSHRLFDVDVSRSSMWLGRALGTAFGTALGTGLETGPETVSTLESDECASGIAVASATGSDRLGSLFCFCGVGAGEVFLRGRKLFGISQRRTRAGSLFQIAAYREFQAEDLVGAIGQSLLDRPAKEAIFELDQRAIGSEVPVEDLRDVCVEAIESASRIAEAEG